MVKVEAGIIIFFSIKGNCGNWMKKGLEGMADVTCAWAEKNKGLEPERVFEERTHTNQIGQCADNNVTEPFKVVSFREEGINRSDLCGLDGKGWQPRISAGPLRRFWALGKVFLLTFLCLVLIRKTERLAKALAAKTVSFILPRVRAMTAKESSRF